MCSPARRSSPTAWIAALIAALTLSAPPAHAAPRATLSAQLSPNRLGADTSVTIGFRINAEPEQELPALSAFALQLPPGMGFASSLLGLETCSREALLRRGVEGCPHESLMGYGTARVQVPFESGGVVERARVYVFMSKPIDGLTTTLFYFDGRQPVIAPLVLQSQVVTPSGSRASVLETTVAPIATVPDGPEVRMVALRITIGPPGLRYFKRVGQRRVPYKPEGLRIPGKCPAGGFRFGAGFSFRDGARSKARTAVPCPAPKERLESGGRP